MTTTSTLPQIPSGNLLSLPRRRELSPNEAARQGVRRRLLSYIVETHRKRALERGGVRFESALGDAT